MAGNGISPGAVVGRRQAVIDLSLERMHRRLAELGNPEKRLPGVVHVAGTNGKGSVIAFMRAMLEAAGRRLHVYTSPSMCRASEGIRLASLPGISAPIGEKRLAHYLTRAQGDAAGDDLTPFEQQTVAVFLAFSESPADLVLLETGLGGRLDATNVVERPLLTVLTPISNDHAEFLGPSLEDIAGEKAGILKSGVPVVVGRQPPEVVEVITARAASLGAPVLEFGRDWDVYEQQGRLVFQNEERLADLRMPGLKGRHQVENAGIAIAAAMALGPFAPDEAAIDRGLARVNWPGRLQRLSGPSPTSEGVETPETWVDGGHNGAAAEVLADAMAEFEEKATRPLHLVVGMLETKDPAAFLAPFRGLAELVIAVPVPDTEHATAGGMPAEVVAGAADILGIDHHTATDLRAALAYSHVTSDGHARILICGSLHLAGEALRMADEAA